MQILQPDGWPRPKGYANGVLATGTTVHVAGQVGWDETETVVSDIFADQVEQALKNIVAVLAEAGAGPQHITRMTWFVVTRDEYPELWNEDFEARIHTMLEEAVDCEMQFAEDLLGGGIPGLSLTDMRQYLEIVADQRLKNLELEPRFGSKNPFSFMELQDVQELSNFFERRVSAYQVSVSGEVAFDEHLIANGIVVKTDDPGEGYDWTIANPINVKEEPKRRPQRAPAIGEHSIEVLRDWGFAADRITRLIDAGTVVVDGANGGGSVLAPTVLRLFGAEVVPVACKPDGANINDGVGALHTDALVADPSLLAEDDPRRQPHQPPRRVFGNIPAGWIAEGEGPGSPDEAFQAPDEGALIDAWLLPSAD